MLTLWQPLFSSCTIARTWFENMVRPDVNGCWSSSRGTTSGSGCWPATGWQWTAQPSRGACIRCDEVTSTKPTEKRSESIPLYHLADVSLLRCNLRVPGNEYPGDGRPRRGGKGNLSFDRFPSIPRL